MSRASDFADVVREAEHQGFSVEHVGNDRWKLRPRDGRRRLVFVAKSTEPRALDNTVAALRRSGFVWPPPARPSNGTVNGRASFTLNDEAEVRCVKCGKAKGDRVRAPWCDHARSDGSHKKEAPSSDEPSVSEPALLAVPGGLPPEDDGDLPPQAEGDEARMDRLFRELKEARLYAKLAEDEERALVAEQDAVARKLQLASAEVARAKENLSRLKADLDEALR